MLLMFVFVIQIYLLSTLAYAISNNFYGQETTRKIKKPTDIGNAVVCVLLNIDRQVPKEFIWGFIGKRCFGCYDVTVFKVKRYLYTLT